MTVQVDTVTMTVVSNYLRNVCQEMGVAMMRTSFSTIFNEGLDFSCVVFDAEGRAIGTGEFCPAQIGAINFVVASCIEELGIETFSEGDVVIHNDPYRGNCHIPEHMVMKPVFFEGELVAFAATIAHMAEVGGKAPGGFAADAMDVYQEGLRLPPVKLMERGERNEDVWKLILMNHRTPRSTWGDLHAMVGALNVGEQRLQSLFSRYGIERVGLINDALFDYSERRMREEIAAIPDGEYLWEDVVEDDGVVPDKPYWIRARVFVDGSDIIFDFRESDDQAQGPCNMTFGSIMSAAYNAMLQVTDPTIPKNAGCYRPIHVLTRPGSIVNVQPPGPSVGGNSEIHPRVVDLILAALAPAIPDRVAASSGGNSCSFLFGGWHPKTGEYFTNYHIEGIGWGGTAVGNGNNSQNVINGNCRNTPIEIFETRFPIRIGWLRLIPDSGGAGQTRGGLACERMLEVLSPDLTVAEFTDRMTTQAWGLFGGLPGSSTATFMRPRGTDEWATVQDLFGTVSNSKYSGIKLKEGDCVMLRTAGGGGYGPPESRDPALVETDVADGFVTREAALRYYGVRIAPDHQPAPAS